MVPGSGILQVALKDEAVLCAAYMPWVKGGGIFITTDKQLRLGSDVFLLLKLMEEPEKIPVMGKVVWVTPQGAQGSRETGIGVQFDGKSELAKDKIETYLAGAMNSERPTHTM